jgi:hypothetical protein
MAVQPFIRRGIRSNATARRLIASSANIAPHVLAQTISDGDIHQPVMRCLSMEHMSLAGVEISADRHFYLVASAKFPGRYYVLVHSPRGWVCSSPDEVVKARCVRQVEAYRNQLAAKLAS